MKAGNANVLTSDDVAMDTIVQKEFKEWIKTIDKKCRIHRGEACAKEYHGQIIDVVKELAEGVSYGYWMNEISRMSHIDKRRRDNGNPSNQFYERLYLYTWTRFDEKRRLQRLGEIKGALVADKELSEYDLALNYMIGLGYLSMRPHHAFQSPSPNLLESEIWHLTDKAFSLLVEPSWFEKYHSRIAFGTGLLTFVMAVVLWLRELGLV